MYFVTQNFGVLRVPFRQSFYNQSLLGIWRLLYARTGKICGGWSWSAAGPEYRNAGAGSFQHTFPAQHDA